MIKFSEINEGKIIEDIKKGKIFIYPTDTIYGLGCDATNFESVKRIRDIKKRNTKPFSVIAPSKEWIRDNLIADEDKLKLLPGPYTLILKLRTKVVSENVSLGLDTLGVRIPDHGFTNYITKANLPFVTTSVNITGEKHVINLQDISESILSKVDVVVDDGILDNKPSKIVNLDEKKW